MSKGNTFEADLLKLIFWGTPIAGLADNAASGPLANLYIALHTSDPGEAGAQNSNECVYTGYARVAVVRSAAGWSISGNVVSPLADIVFGACSAGAEVASYASVGTDASGTGKLLYKGALSPTISISPGVAPVVAAGSTITEE